MIRQMNNWFIVFLFKNAKESSSFSCCKIFFKEKRVVFADHNHWHWSLYINDCETSNNWGKQFCNSFSLFSSPLCEEVYNQEFKFNHQLNAIGECYIKITDLHHHRWSSAESWLYVKTMETRAVITTARMKTMNRMPYRAYTLWTHMAAKM